MTVYAHDYVYAYIRTYVYRKKCKAMHILKLTCTLCKFVCTERSTEFLQWEESVVLRGVLSQEAWLGGWAWALRELTLMQHLYGFGLV